MTVTQSSYLVIGDRQGGRSLGMEAARGPKGHSCPKGWARLLLACVEAGKAAEKVAVTKGPRNI